MLWRGRSGVFSVDGMMELVVRVCLRRWEVKDRMVSMVAVVEMRFGMI